MKKVFVITMFGSPFSWINDYIDNVQHLAKYGWYWKIFTPHSIESKGNVEIVRMDTDQFNDLVEKKLGVRPNMGVTEKGVPTVHVTDFYVASGVIFEDYLKDDDFWGITNLDVVYGRLDRFIPDSALEKVEIFTDDTGGVVNGVFSLWRNNEKVNNLFRLIPDWEQKLSLPHCPRCTGTGNEHILAGTDEYDMTDILKKVKPYLLYPFAYPLHGHDRLEMHFPDVKLEIKDDGSLWELMTDVGGPQWIHSRPVIGREIPYFHFIRTKKWPECLKK